MSVPFILIATACYVLTTVSCLRQRDYPMALVWASYSLANIGFVWYELSKRT